jgi:hypothetical protein
MGLFKKKPPPLDDAQIIRLLRMATVDLSYSAVQHLYLVYGNLIPAPRWWTWWLDQAEALALAGNRSVAHLAIEFARKADVPRWGPPNVEHHERMKQIEMI